eukprot:s5684_g2.t1
MVAAGSYGRYSSMAEELKLSKVVTSEVWTRQAADPMDPMGTSGATGMSGMLPGMWFLAMLGLLGGATLIREALKMELTDSNFKKALEGKNAFVFFQAPWCGHCRKLQPEWDQMAKLYVDTPNVIIGQVDCTGSGQGFCGENQVQGYPTLKLWKDGRMQDYNGGRDFNSLKREVEKKLDPRPACSLESKDACKPEDLKVLEESEKMTKAERAAKIKAVQKEIADAKTEAAELEKKAKRLTESLDLIKAGGQTVEKVEQLLNDEDWRAHCEATVPPMSLGPGCSLVVTEAGYFGEKVMVAGVTNKLEISEDGEVTALMKLTGTNSENLLKVVVSRPRGSF